VIRLLGAGLLALSLGAPLQCGSGSDPAVRREDSAGDALYNLAQDFRAKGNEAAARDTLRYLVQHYPSNRHAPAARAELEGEPTAKSAAPAEK
jgi:Tfp pilus assembly protein PilF